MGLNCVCVCVCVCVCLLKANITKINIWYNQKVLGDIDISRRTQMEADLYLLQSPSILLISIQCLDWRC